MSMDPQRQIDQLWIVAKMYHELALNLKSHMDVAPLQLTVREFAEHCKDLSYLHKNIALLYASAHLSSSAIRLYSIEEVRKSKSIRWTEYDRIRKMTDKHQVEQDVKTQTDSLVHFLLRHMVAHSEFEWKRFKQYKIAYEAMHDIYFDLDYNTIFAAMSTVIERIKKELSFP